MRDYLSCKIRFNSKRTKAWIGQPHILENLEKKFGNDVQHMRSTKTPGTPYHSGVGMLLYLVKHSHPDIANTVRELSKVLDGANMAAYKEMH